MLNILLVSWQDEEDEDIWSCDYSDTRYSVSVKGEDLLLHSDNWEDFLHKIELWGSFTLPIPLCPFPASRSLCVPLKQADFN